MVRITEPSWLIASARQELIRRPSTRMVQAPHCPRSQPFLVPVKWSCSRRRSSSVTRGSCNVILRTTPFTVSEIDKLMRCSDRCMFNVERDLEARRRHLSRGGRAPRLRQGVRTRETRNACRADEACKTCGARKNRDACKKRDARLPDHPVLVSMRAIYGGIL